MTRKGATDNKKAAKARKKTGAKYWIEKLRLEPHPEGGYFRQTYKAELRIVPEARPDTDGSLARSDRRRGQNAHSKIANGAILEWGTQSTKVGHPNRVRAAATGIYFLLEGENFSAFHRLRSDEMWHFYAGSPLAVQVIGPAGEYSSILLGKDPEAGQVFQAVVEAGCWFASELVENPHLSQNQGEVGHPPYALVGCTVAPGFEFEDFELASREELVREFPDHRKLIERLTRE